MYAFFFPVDMRRLIQNAFSERPNRDTLDGGDADEGQRFLCALHDSPMSSAIGRVSLYCHANVAQQRVSHLWRYGVGLSLAKGQACAPAPNLLL